MDERESRAAKPTFGSLFAGIGGIDLGLERAGWSCSWQVEWDAYCRRILGRHWPGIPRFGDVKEVHGPLAHADGRNGDGRTESGEGRTGGIALRCASCLPLVDLVAGGFPCQPVSNAGKRAAQADERWLWPEFARIVREVGPRYVLVENVPGLLNANDGTAMGEVLGGLASLGYDCEWESVPAAALGAPHLRYRVFIVGIRTRDVAYPHFPGAPGAGVRQEVVVGGIPEGSGAEPGGAGGDVADADGLYGGRETEARAGPEAGGGAGAPDDALSRSADAGGDGGVFGDEPPAPGADESAWWSAEPGMGRVADGVPDRVDRLKCLGNAVVPPVVRWVGERIWEHKENRA